MNKIFQVSLLVFIIIGSTLVVPNKVLAVCPVCTVAVGAGLGISRWLGIDDSVAGIWIGGLALSSGLWLAGWVAKKDWRFPKKDWLAGASFYILLKPTLYLLGIAGAPFNTLWGIDKIILGIIVGTGAFALSVSADKYLRSINEEKVFIYYQKVILPILFLTIVSFIFHLLT